MDRKDLLVYQAFVRRLHEGIYDQKMAEIIDLVGNRNRAIRQERTSVMRSTIKPGVGVELSSTLKPRRWAGTRGRVLEVKYSKALVQVGDSVVRVPLSALSIESP